MREEKREGEREKEKKRQEFKGENNKKLAVLYECVIRLQGRKKKIACQEQEL